MQSGGSWRTISAAGDVEGARPPECMRGRMEQAPSISDLREVALRIRESVQRVVVGKSEAIDLALVALLCRGHVLVEDVPGVGKTTMAKALAESLGCSFSRIQFTPDLMPGDILGVNYFNQKSSDFEFRPGPIFSQVLLGDEINRATPRTQSALLEAMQEAQATVDGVTMPLPRPFLVMATQNPVEMEGTFPLPEAQLDRFMVKVVLGYPTPQEESDIFVRFDRDAVLPRLEAVTSAEELSRLQQVPSTVRVDEPVRRYVVEIVGETRTHAGISVGASPRAGLALYKASQARASMDERDFVTPDDVKAMAAPVLAHRLILSHTTRLSGSTPEELVAEVLSTVAVPIER